MELGKFIKKIRKRQALTKRKLASLVGVSHSSR